MKHKQYEDYKYDIQRELSTQVFSWMGVGGSTIRREDTLSYWFNGGRTNIGTLHNVNSKDLVLELIPMIKEELLELKDTLVIDWNEEKETLDFYLEFKNYSKMIDRMTKGYMNI